MMRRCELFSFEGSGREVGRYVSQWSGEGGVGGRRAAWNTISKDIKIFALFNMSYR
jgi:hypothetical protein